jgi:hypothetical protein
MKKIASLALFAVILASAAMAAIKPEPIPELKPPRSELPPEPIHYTYWPWFVAGGALLVAVVIALMPRKRSVPVEHPYERAARELRAMENRGPEAAAVLAVFQRYINAMLPVPGPGLTPDEMCAVLAQHPRWTPEYTVRFQRLFDPVELAKFAPVPPPPGDPVVTEALVMLNLVEDMRRWIPAPVAPPTP